MARQKGIASFSANFEPQIKAPLDARLVCPQKTLLTLMSTWKANDGNIYLYKGITVAVTDDEDPTNNGLYQLKDLDYTIESNWEKVGSTGGTNFHNELQNLDYASSGHTGFQPTLTFDNTPTADSTNPVTSEGIKDALDLKADQTSLTAHIENTNNPHSVTKEQVGLSNVDNTSDLDKPVSTATQSEIDTKQDTLTFDTTPTADSTNPVTSGGINTALGLKVDQTSLTAHITDTENPHSVTKTQVGLGNVDNTSDLNKPISTATQAEIDTKQDILTSDNAGTGISIENGVISNTGSGSGSNYLRYSIIDGIKDSSNNSIVCASSGTSAVIRPVKYCTSNGTVSQSDDIPQIFGYTEFGTPNITNNVLYTRGFEKSIYEPNLTLGDDWEMYLNYTVSQYVNTVDNVFGFCDYIHNDTIKGTFFLDVTGISYGQFILKASTTDLSFGNSSRSSFDIFYYSVGDKALKTSGAKVNIKVVRKDGVYSIYYYVGTSGTYTLVGSTQSALDIPTIRPFRIGYTYSTSTACFINLPEVKIYKNGELYYTPVATGKSIDLSSYADGTYSLALDTDKNAVALGKDYRQKATPVVATANNIWLDTSDENFNCYRSDSSGNFTVDNSTYSPPLGTVTVANGAITSVTNNIFSYNGYNGLQESINERLLPSNIIASTGITKTVSGNNVTLSVNSSEIGLGTSNIADGTTLTVGTGEDFTDLYSAITYLDGKLSNGTVTIKISAGTFTMNTACNIDASSFNIPLLIIEGTVTDNTNSTTLQVTTNSTGLEIIKVYNTNSGKVQIKDLNLTGVQDSDSRGITVSSNAQVFLSNLSLTSFVKGVHAHCNSNVVVKDTTITITNTTTAYYIYSNSNLTFADSTVNISNTTTGIYAYLGSSVSATGATLNNTATTNFSPELNTLGNSGSGIWM